MYRDNRDRGGSSYRSSSNTGPSTLGRLSTPSFSSITMLNKGRSNTGSGWNDSQGFGSSGQSWGNSGNERGMGGSSGGGRQQMENVNASVFLDMDSAPTEFDAVTRVIGENGENLEYIRKTTGAQIQLQGRGTGIFNQKALHIYIEHNQTRGLERAEKLAGDLVKVVQEEYIQWQETNRSRMGGSGSGNYSGNQGANQGGQQMYNQGRRDYNSSSNQSYSNNNRGSGYQDNQRGMGDNFPSNNQRGDNFNSGSGSGRYNESSRDSGNRQMSGYREAGGSGSGQGRGNWSENNQDNFNRSSDFPERNRSFTTQARLDSAGNWHQEEFNQEKGSQRSSGGNWTDSGRSGNQGRDNMNRSYDREGDRGMDRGMGRNIERGNMDRSMDRGNMDRSIERGNMDRSMDRGNLDRSMDRGNMDRSMDRGNMDRSMDRGNMDRSMDRGNMDRSMDRGNMDRSMDRGNMDRGIDRNMDRGMDRNMDRGMDRNMDRGMDRNMDRGIDRNMDRGIDRNMDRGIDRNMDRGMDRNMDRGLDRNIDRGMDRDRGTDRERGVDRGMSRNMDPPPAPKRKYCDICDETFPNDEAYQTHCNGVYHAEMVLDIKTRNQSGVRGGQPANQGGGKPLRPQIVLDMWTPEQDGMFEQGWVYNQVAPLFERQLEQDILKKLQEYCRSVVSREDVMPDRQYQHPNNYCKLCKVTFSDLRLHVGSNMHITYYILRQIQMGVDTFVNYYGDVPIANVDTDGGRILALEALNWGPALPNANMGKPQLVERFKKLVVLSGPRNGYKCDLCRARCANMNFWVDHCTSVKHVKKLVGAMCALSREGFVREFPHTPVSPPYFAAAAVPRIKNLQFHPDIQFPGGSNVQRIGSQAYNHQGEWFDFRGPRGNMNEPRSSGPRQQRGNGGPGGNRPPPLMGSDSQRPRSVGGPSMDGPGPQGQMKQQRPGPGQLRPLMDEPVVPSMDTLSPADRELVMQVSHITGIQDMTLVMSALEALRALDPNMIGALGSLSTQAMTDVDPAMIQTLLTAIGGGDAGALQAGSPSGPTPGGPPKRRMPMGRGGGMSPIKKGRF